MSDHSSVVVVLSLLHSPVVVLLWRYLMATDMEFVVQDGRDL